jgi:hypothetical protein
MYGSGVLIFSPASFFGDIMLKTIHILFLFFLCQAAFSNIAHIEIDKVREIQLANGTSYELMKGKLFFEIDPAAPDNAIIIDLSLAPINDNGLVEFSSDFELLRPSNATDGNNILVADILNRGSRRVIRYFNFASNYDSSIGPLNLGDEFLMNHGFSILSVGWQFDVPNNTALLRSYVPAVELTSEQIMESVVRSDFLVDRVTERHTLGDRLHFAYPVTKDHVQFATLTRRDLYTDVRDEVNPSLWQFINDPDESEQSYLSGPDDYNAVIIEGGFQPGQVYEVVYRSHRTAIAGLGLAAIRDANLYFKENLYFDRPGDLQGSATVIAFGDSQSGRTLRTYLHDGFNVREDQMVFDGVMIHLGANARGGFNQRFAQASRAVDRNYNYPADQFPFSDQEIIDPKTSLFSGLLSAYHADHIPKIFYSNSSTEYWRSPAYLIHTSPDRTADVDSLSSSRIFQFSGTQHVPSGSLNLQSNTNIAFGNNAKYQWFLRAFVIAMKDWLLEGDEPPVAIFPNLDSGTLVRAESIQMPEDLNILPNKNINHGFGLNYGDNFLTHGVPVIEPPSYEVDYPLMVSAVDHNGNEVGGLLPWEVAVPLATYTGWVPGNPKSSIGMVIPFVAIDSDNGIDNIPDLYNSEEAYINEVSQYLDVLIGGGYVLSEDKVSMIREAEMLWAILGR